MWSLIGKTIDRCFAVCGAFAFCQLPLIMSQYTILLSGHLAESRREINLLQHAASINNKTLQEYIQKFLGQEDMDFVHQGEFMQALQMRYESLSESYNALQDSGIFAKPFVFLMHADGTLFWDTVSDFSPGITLSLETGAYALVGLLFGVLLYRGLAKGLAYLYRLFVRPRQGQSPPFESPS